MLILLIVSSLPHRFTARITELMKVLKELNAGRYERTMVTQQDKGKEGLVSIAIKLLSAN